MEIKSYQIHIEMDATAFIIPNCPIVPANEPAYRSVDGKKPVNSHLLEGLQKMAELNGRTFDPSDPLIEMWLYTDDCQNLRDHHPIVDVCDNSYELSIDNGSHIPYSYLKDLKEGDTLEIKIPITLINWSKDARIQGVWNASLTMSQRYSRYSHFGPFEKCLEGLMIRNAPYLLAEHK